MYVCWEITTRCNLSCHFCYSFKDLPDVPLKNMLTIADALISSKVQVINITGGEPFLSQQLVNIIEYCYKNCKLLVSTHGMFLDKEIVFKLKSKIRLLGVSLDTLAENDAKLMRGKGYDLGKVLANINLLLSNKMRFKINTIVTKYNKDTLHEIAEFIESLNNPDILWKLYELTINDNVSKTGRLLKIPHNQFLGLVQELKAKYTNIRIVYSDSDTMNSAYIIITPRGEVHIPSKKDFRPLGNLLEQPLIEILSQNDFDFDLNKKVMAYI